MDEYERVLLVKPEVFVYRIPPLQSNRGYRAADWGLDKPDWTGRMRVMAKNKDCFIRLEDNAGELFAQCPVMEYPGRDVEQVKDSSRYFVIRVIDDKTKRSAFIGIGFGDRGDSFDLNVTLQDHFKWKNAPEVDVNALENQPKLDLAFKEGQTITIKNMNFPKTSDKVRPAAGASGGAAALGFLPPPPGENVPRLTPPPPPPPAISSNFFSVAGNGNPPQQPPPASKITAGEDAWGDFEAANLSSKQKTMSQMSSGQRQGDDASWVQF